MQRTIPVYEVVLEHSEPSGQIIRDVHIKLTDPKTSRKYPETLRLVEAVVEVDGKPRQMVFPANNMQWAASSICDLYESRWGIEVLIGDKADIADSRFYGIFRECCALADITAHFGNYGMVVNSIQHPPLRRH